MTTILHMEPAAHKCASLLVGKFSEIAGKGDVVNMQAWLQYYAFDVIGLITVRFFPSTTSVESDSLFFSSLNGLAS